MLVKKLFELASNYKFHFFKIIFFEFIYIIRGYKGNQFYISKNDSMTANIPCPFYFLVRIEKQLKKINFNTFMDLGCGSGRVLDFFNKKFKNKKYIGIDYFEEYCDKCKKAFSKNNNIEIIKSDFTKLDLDTFNVDCIFYNDPVYNENNSIIFLNRVINLMKSNRDMIFILINCSNKILDKLDNSKCIDSYYVNKIKGYSIYYFKKQ